MNKSDSIFLIDSSVSDWGGVASVDAMPGAIFKFANADLAFVLFGNFTNISL